MYDGISKLPQQRESEDNGELNRAVQKFADEKSVKPELSWEYITSPHGLTRSFGQTAGGKPYSLNPFRYAPDQVQEALEGYFGSLPLGIAPAVNHVVSRHNTNVQNFDRDSDETISNADYAARANRMARPGQTLAVPERKREPRRSAT